ncbi:type II toxin-antitoxin system RelE/ParE family toxin [Aureimonas psammosilenae]|uniref:type II toxin-antitoxin system RelE/ParE family toxin n=1 Tax=Aureimonas psammosilenae TaxID=2495496 RepID=UPI00126067BF|nr:type II toxin-antitoxin system RelE/ParE family toxin [Aureimonas psammosilenae]
MRLRYSAAALRQIDAALSFVGERSPQGAASLRKRILAAAALVQDHPYAAQATSRANTRRVVLAPHPYVLFYRVAADEVFITRFRHTARKPLEGVGRKERVGGR